MCLLILLKSIIPYYYISFTIIFISRHTDIILEMSSEEPPINSTNQPPFQIKDHPNRTKGAPEGGDVGRSEFPFVSTERSGESSQRGWNSRHEFWKGYTGYGVTERGTYLKHAVTGSVVAIFPDGCIEIYAEESLKIYTKNSLLIKSREDIALDAGKNLFLRADESINMSSKKINTFTDDHDTTSKTYKVTADTIEMVAKTIKPVTDNIEISMAEVEINSRSINFTASNSIKMLTRDIDVNASGSINTVARNIETDTSNITTRVARNIEIDASSITTKVARNIETNARNITSNASGNLILNTSRNFTLSTPGNLTLNTSRNFILNASGMFTINSARQFRVNSSAAMFRTGRFDINKAEPPEMSQLETDPIIPVIPATPATPIRPERFVPNRPPKSSSARPRINSFNSVPLPDLEQEFCNFYLICYGGGSCEATSKTGKNGVERELPLTESGKIEEKLPSGDIIKMTFTPDDDCYEYTNVSVAGQQLGPKNPVMIDRIGIRRDTTVFASFKRKKFKVFLHSNSSVNVVPAGNTYVKCSDNFSMYYYVRASSNITRVIFNRRTVNLPQNFNVIKIDATTGQIITDDANPPDTRSIPLLPSTVDLNPTTVQSQIISSLTPTIDLRTLERQQEDEARWNATKENLGVNVNSPNFDPMGQSLISGLGPLESNIPYRIKTDDLNISTKETERAVSDTNLFDTMTDQLINPPLLSRTESELLTSSDNQYTNRGDLILNSSLESFSSEVGNKTGRREIIFINVRMDLDIKLEATNTIRQMSNDTTPPHLQSRIVEGTVKFSPLKFDPDNQPSWLWQKWFRRV
jgi:hypothetical protein